MSAVDGDANRSRKRSEAGARPGRKTRILGWTSPPDGTSARSSPDQINRSHRRHVAIHEMFERRDFDEFGVSHLTC